MKHTLLYILGLFVWLCNMHAQSSVDTKIAVNSQNDDKTFVVIISNENYKHEENVPFAKNDGEVFKVYCQKTLGIPENNIRYIPDATLNEMNFEIDWLGDVLNAYEGDARGIIYYTGHGMPDENSKEAYLLPVDGYSKSPSSGMSTKSLYDKLRNMHSNSIMVFLDACFSGAKRDGKMLASSRGVALKVRQDPVGDNTVVFSAAQGDETAYPYKSQQHGMFTYYLLDKLQQSGGNTTLGELCSYVTTHVKRKSVVENGKSQTPSIITSSNNQGWKNWLFAATAACKFEKRVKNSNERIPKEEIQATEYKTSIQDVSFQSFNDGNINTRIEKGLTNNYNPLSEDPTNVALVEMGKNEIEKRKYTSASKHFLEAASQGSVEANYQLGHLYKDSGYKKSNINVAMSFFSKAANAGHIKSMYELGSLYVGTWYILYKAQKDTIQAIKWFYEAANLGDVESMYEFGLIYNNKSNKELARAWLQKAANLGHVESMYHLGYCYINSDNELSQEWFRKAANKGHKYAQEELKNFVNGYYNPPKPPKPSSFESLYSGF